MTPSTKETMPVKVGTLAIAIALAVTGFAGTASGGVKLHYDRAHHAAVKRCGDERAAGRNVFREHSTLSNGERVGARRYRKLTAKLDGLCRPVSVSAPQRAPVAATSAATALTPHASGDGVGGSTVQCESGGNYGANTGNGFYGGWQFDSQTWDAYGDSRYGEANEAPPSVQDQAAANVPYDAWPNC